MKTLLLLRSICYMLHNIIVFCKLYFAYKSLSYLTIVEKVVEIIEKSTDCSFTNLWRKDISGVYEITYLR